MTSGRAIPFQNLGMVVNSVFWCTTIALLLVWAIGPRSTVWYDSFSNLSNLLSAVNSWCSGPPSVQNCALLVKVV